ncbi:hypothetical protein E2C01_091779 [Portunus trituberculatus]|uniref:Uncharacterized protein n=1 Tax=Portunus trituberculatus TaxID=210409 RepID=A0A5B7JQA6_PORTR|nr:hypothetical protein [Portunus trituberculatus]
MSVSVSEFKRSSSTVPSLQALSRWTVSAIQYQSVPTCLDNHSGTSFSSLAHPLPLAVPSGTVLLSEDNACPSSLLLLLLLLLLLRCHVLNSPPLPPRV